MKKVFECACFSEGVTVDHDDGFVNMCFWERGIRPSKRSMLDRLRVAWHLIRKGEYYTDEVMLKPDEARALGEEIIKLSEEAAVYEKAAIESARQKSAS
jgi:hypothetical protein